MKLAFVTGGSRGLGAAVCTEYIARGWRVLEFSRSAPFDHSVRVDMSDPLAAATVFERTFAAFDDVEPAEVVAIGSAGVIGPVGPVDRFPVAAVAANLNTNAVAAILFARAFIAAFQNRACPKTFVNVSSGAAVRGYAGWSLYCAAKAATEHFVRCVALEQSARPHPVRAFSVPPGVMDTAMQATVRASNLEDFPSVERFVRLYEDDRLADPSMVAARIADIVASRPEPGGVYAVG